MAAVNTYKCDTCGTIKKEANHWYWGMCEQITASGYRFSLHHWNVGLNDKAQHFCGLGCATKAMVSAMSEKPEAVEGERT